MKKILCLALLGALAVPAAASRLLAPKGMAAGSNPRGLAVADFNGDGYADAAVANFGSGTLIGQACPADAGSISIFWGSAAGLQPGPVLPLSGDAPRGLAAVDLNGDGHPDLLATLYCSGRLAVYLYQGPNSFAAPVYYPVGALPVGVATIQRDGKTWVAVADYGSSAVSLFTANADGSLQAAGTLSGFAGPTDVKFYPSARRLSLVVANYLGNSVSQVGLKPDGTPSGRTDTALSGQPCKIMVGDLNGDGIPDVAVARFTDSALSVFLGQSDGGLAIAPISVGLAGSHPNGLAMGTVAGLPALVTADRDSDHVEVVRYSAGTLSCTSQVLIADAAGNTGTYGPVEVGLGDVNGDGLNDILLTHMRSGRLVVMQAALPLAPAISSPTHPQDVWSSATNFQASWAPGTDLNGIDHYLVAFDQVAGTIPAGGAQNGQTFSTTGLSTGTYYLHVRAVDAAGKAGDTATYKVGVTAGLSKADVYNYPNPTRDGNTTIRFPLLSPAAVQIRIYDAMGALVWSDDLGPGQTYAGVNTVAWDGRNGEGRPVANGGYILTVQSGGILITKKIAVIR
jgi:hypothetical protein